MLTNGQVLVAGGAANGAVVSSAELFNPVTGTWTPTGALNAARCGHTATLLTNWQVLVVGGTATGDYPLSSAELYNPSNGTWTNTGVLNDTRSAHTATLLTNGQVLVAGGYDSNLYNLASTELYNPATGTWTLSSLWSSETTWNWYITNPPHTNSSGGGISVNYTIPGWQQGINMTTNHGSTTMRNVPDVALTADNIYVIADNGTGYSAGGTSAASPLWAGFTALVNQQAVANGGETNTIGFINPAIYAIGKSTNYTADFHDITTGNNTNLVSHTNFFAVPGYDLCTGWGTPTGQNLINNLAPPDSLGITPTSGFTASGPAGGPFDVTTQNFSLTNSGLASLDWTLVNTSSWLNASPESGALAVGGRTNVTVSLNSTVNQMAEGIYTADIWFTNLTTGVAQSRQFNLLIEGTIQNGGFETGDFSYWTLWGDINTTFVYGGFYGSVTHSGNYGALLSTTGSLGYISQTVVTVPGQKYLLSLWFNNTVNPAPGHPATPNEFSVAWDGTTLFDQVNMPVTGMLIGWTNLQFVVTATASSSVLQFGFRNDPWHFGLDDVSLWPWPIVTPSFQSITQSTNTVWLGWTALPGLPYQMQYKTNLLQPNWINWGSIVTATNATMTIPDVIGPDPQRFYRIEWVPTY